MFGLISKIHNRWTPVMHKAFQTVYKNSPNLQIHHESLYFWINCSSQVTGVHIPSDEFVRNTDNISEIYKASYFNLSWTNHLFALPLAGWAELLRTQIAQTMEVIYRLHRKRCYFGVFWRIFWRIVWQIVLMIFFWRIWLMNFL